MRLINTKNIWKYVFYTCVGLLILYFLFSSTREHFTAVNPLPTVEEFDALSKIFKEIERDKTTYKNDAVKIGASVLARGPKSFQIMAKYIKENVIPLLSYQASKNLETSSGNMTDYYFVWLIPTYKDILLPIFYDVKRQSSPPTLSEFIDTTVKTVRSNTGPQQDRSKPLDPKVIALIEQAKKGSTTIEDNGQTMPNPGYWMYKYIYGDKTPSGSSKSNTASTSGSIGGSKCVPSIHGVPGGMTETRCFND